MEMRPSSPTTTASDDAEERAALLHLVRQQLPLKVRHATFASFDPNPDRGALKLAQQWVEAVSRWFAAGKPDGGPSLLLTSERPGELAAFGNGKSHLAASALLSLADRGLGRIYKFEGGRGENWPSLMWITSADLIALVRATYSRTSDTTAAQVVSRFAWADVLALDDVGTEGTGDDVTPHMFRLMELRAGKPTIYTSNYGRKQLAERSPEWGKLTSRMALNLKGAVLRGPDRREKAKEADPWGEWT
jgi:DNA replication protein DnaC